MAGRDVVFRVKRYRLESGGKPAYQEYRIPYRDDMVVLVERDAARVAVDRRRRRVDDALDAVAARGE